MARLWSDIRGSGRYWYDLDGAPGVVTPGVGLVTLAGNIPLATEPVSVFRTPATATITLNGLSLSSPTVLTPALAALGYVGQIPSELRTLIITNSISLDYSEPVSNAPTILFVNTITPDPASLTIQALSFSLAQGGDIVTITPSVGAITFSQLSPNVAIGPVSGGITVEGRQPTLSLELIIVFDFDDDDPQSQALLSVNGLAPTLQVPFHWVDVDAPPSLTWS